MDHRERLSLAAPPVTSLPIANAPIDASSTMRARNQQKRKTRSLPFIRARRVYAQLSGILRRRVGLSSTIYIDQRLDELRGYWSEAASMVGARFLPVTDSIWEIRIGEKSTLVSNHLVQADDPVILELAADKAHCARLAKRVGAPMPSPWVCLTLDQMNHAQEFLREVSVPIVIKPAGGDSGRGVTTCIRSRAQVQKAVILASLHSRNIIAQPMIPGESCRLLFLGGEFVDAVRRRGIHVQGDGRRKVHQLLGVQGWSMVRNDPMVPPTLAAQGLHLDSVLDEGADVLVRGWPAQESNRRELRTIYDDRITTSIHPEIVEQAGRLVTAIGSAFAGVDLVSVNPSLPNSITGGAFLEVNTTPSIHHHYLNDGSCRVGEPVAVLVLKHLLERAEHRTR